MPILLSTSSYSSYKYSMDSTISGAIAGCCTRIVAAPLDLLKIRFQIQSKQNSNLYSMVYKVYQEEGLKSFWRGNLAATWLWVSYSGIQFGCYGYFKHLIQQSNTSSFSFIQTGLAGATAGIVATSITYPFDLIRTIFASQGIPKEFFTMRSLIHYRYRNEGIPSLFRGVMPAIIQIGPYMGFSFMIYESLQHFHQIHSMKLNQLSSSKKAFYSGIYGGIAGFLSKLSVYPFDTVKKRMQIQGMKRYASSTTEGSHAFSAGKHTFTQRYRSSWHCAQCILMEEGWKAFYKGTIPSLLKAFVGHSCTFACYEMSMNMLEYFHDV